MLTGSTTPLPVQTGSPNFSLFERSRIVKVSSPKPFLLLRELKSVFERKSFIILHQYLQTLKCGLLPPYGGALRPQGGKMKS
ncbi:MAG: hypothetical protein D6828_04205, partial [Nitrospirae bacterium]